MSTTYESMAIDIFLNGGNIAEIMKKHGVEFLQGKGNKDFSSAFRKGVDLGRGKFEREMMHAGIELAKVCRVMK